MLRLTLEQVQALVPQAQSMEFRGVPDLGSLEEHLKVSDQMTWLVASDGARSMNQTSGRFSVQRDALPSARCCCTATIPRCEAISSGSPAM